MHNSQFTIKLIIKFINVMEFKRAKVEKILPVECGTSERGDWKSQSIVVCEELPVPYPDRVRIDFRGDKVDQLRDIHEGDVVHVVWTSGVTERTTMKDGREVHFMSGYHRGHLIERVIHNS